jgi:hypothetical protein
MVIKEQYNNLLASGGTFTTVYRNPCLWTLISIVVVGPGTGYWILVLQGAGYWGPNPTKAKKHLCSACAVYKKDQKCDLYVRLVAPYRGNE